MHLINTPKLCNERGMLALHSSVLAIRYSDRWIVEINNIVYIILYLPIQYQLHNDIDDKKIGYTVQCTSVNYNQPE